MDCDCELLRNEGPSIPVYGFFSFTSPVSLALLTHTLCMHMFRDAAK